MRVGEGSRIVVTGPTGAVGNALIDELISLGADVTAVCRKGSPRITNLTRKHSIDIVECDLSDYAGLGEILEGPYDAFYHLAWAGTSGSARQEWGTQALNALGALQAAQAAVELSCEVFVGVGSQAEYGHVEGKMRPHAECNPDTGYGAAKLAAKDLTKAFCGHAGIRHEWCRILSLYGPGDRAQSLVMDVINSLVSGKRPTCTPCEQMWDFIYSRDAARAMRLVAEKGKDGETYLIATGDMHPLSEFVCSIRDVVNPEADIGFGELPYYPNQAMRLDADVSNLMRDTGFRARYTFEDGIRETVEWVLSRSAMEE